VRKRTDRGARWYYPVSMKSTGIVVLMFLALSLYGCGAELVEEPPPVVSVGEWSMYRDFTFNAYSDQILRGDDGTAQEVALFISQNDNFRIAIDGANANRVGVVRRALLDAGIPAYKIQVGTFGDSLLRRDTRVAVLIGN